MTHFAREKFSVLSAGTLVGFFLSGKKPISHLTLCEKKSLNESNCEEYNSFFNIFFEKRREELCKKEIGCNFRGKGITGTCFPKYKIAKFSDGGAFSSRGAADRTTPVTAQQTTDGVPQKKQSKQPSKLTKLSNVSSPAPATAGSVRVMKGDEDSQIEVMMKQQFTSSVADQIVNSHDAAREVAKALVIEVLQSEGTVNELGSLLGLCFSYPTVQSPIRSLAYFYLHADVTMINILWQLEWQRNYFFFGDGKDWTIEKLKDLAVWWTTTQDFKDVVYPLVLWVLRDRDISVVPLSKMNAEYYNYYQDWFAKTLEEAIVDHLKSEREQLRVAASEVIKDLLISNFKAKSEHHNEKVSSDTSSRKDQQDSEKGKNH